MNTELINEYDRFDVIAFSGGKDSLATLLVAIEREINFLCVFADTGNEHPITYDYIGHIEQELGIEIRRVKADFSERISKKRDYIKKNWGKELRRTVWGRERVRRPLTDAEIKETLSLLHPTGNPMVDLFLWKGMIASPRQKFCSIELKQLPILTQVYEPLQSCGFLPVGWQGVRAQESSKRSSYGPVEVSPDGIILYRPILLWKHEDVFRLIKRHGLKENPLYSHGMSRVGCMPCINCSSQEIHEIARRFPEEIARIHRLEQLIAKVTRHPETRERRCYDFFSMKMRDKDKGKGVYAYVNSSQVSSSYKDWVQSPLYQDEIDPDSCSAVYPIVCE